jgi:hypothetical protein
MKCNVPRGDEPSMIGLCILLSIRSTTTQEWELNRPLLNSSIRSRPIIYWIPHLRRVTDQAEWSSDKSAGNVTRSCRIPSVTAGHMPAASGST